MPPSQPARSRPTPSRRAACIYHARGYCRNGPACRFSHDAPRVRGHKRSAQECGICLEDPRDSGGRFGLLAGCDHAFCMPCLTKWRNAKDADGVRARMRRTCPECRMESGYVVPSFDFVTGEQKREVVGKYRASCAGISCRLFGTPRGCPFGNLCFYKHVGPDGEEVDKEEALRLRGPDTGRVPARAAVRRASAGARGRRLMGAELLQDVLAAVDQLPIPPAAIREIRASAIAAVAQGSRVDVDHPLAESLVAALMDSLEAGFSAAIEAQGDGAVRGAFAAVENVQEERDENGASMRQGGNASSE